MEQKTRLDLPLLLPDVKDLRDACVARLVRLLEGRDGVTLAHVAEPGAVAPQDRGERADPAAGPQLCLHYDPERLSLSQVTALAHAAGAQVTDRYAHAVLPFRGFGSEDDGARIEAYLRALPGVSAASVNFAGQLARVEFDRRRVGLPAIRAQLADAGVTPLGVRTPRAVAAIRDAAAPDGTDHGARSAALVDAHLRGAHGTPARTGAPPTAPEHRVPADHDERSMSQASAAAMGLAPEGDGRATVEGPPPAAAAGEPAPDLQPAPATTPPEPPPTTAPHVHADGESEEGHEEDGEEHDHAAEGGGWYARNRELAWSLASGALLVAGWLIARGGPSMRPVSIAFYVGAYVFGARDNVGHLFKDLRRGHFHFNIDLLMVVAAVGAAVLGQWVEGALLLFLFSLGHALEHYALGRARNAIKALADLAPQVATVVRDGREATVTIEQVKPGDRVVVKPAERIPVDGTVAEGKSAVNQAPITGESVPVDKAPGEQVFAGSVNGEGALVVEVTAAIGDRTLDRVVKLVAEAQTQKAPTQQFTDRFERVFVPLVLVADVLLIVVPPLLFGWTWSQSFYRAMALLVAASPCALALGTPAAVLAGIAQAARKGVLIKGGAHLEALGTIGVLALDKTGTITKGEPAVTDVVTADGVGEAELIAMTAAVERRSQHPLARAVMAAAEERAIDVPDAGDVESVTGHGVRAPVGGVVVEVGRMLMFERLASTDHPDARVPARLRDAVVRLEGSGRTTMVVRRRAGVRGDGAGDGAIAYLGVLGLADEPRAGVRETLDRLRRSGIRRIVMLTGDNEGVGKAVGDAVGVDEVRAGLLPEDKVIAIKELAARGRVAMVGDGVNDAPALAHATVGIAMGGAGTAAALETADVALMGDDLGRLPFAIGLSRQARAVIKQNLVVSLGVIVLLVVATTTGLLGIGPAVVAHEGSTLVVIANALRLLAYGRRE